MATMTTILQGYKMAVYNHMKDFKKNILPKIMKTMKDNDDNIINVKRFGATGTGKDDTLALQKAFDAARDENKSVYVPAGIYYVTEELKLYTRLSGENMENTVFDARGMVSTLDKDAVFTSRTGNDVFTYERPEKAIINFEGTSRDVDISNLHLRSGDDYVNDEESWAEHVKPICAIRIRGEDLSPNQGYAALYNIERVRSVNLHTALDILGFIGNISSLFIRAAHIGILASEFNDATVSYSCSLVRHHIRIYEAQSVVFSACNSQATNDFELMSGYIDNAKGIHFNGFYSEGTLSDHLLRVGTLQLMGTYEDGVSQISFSGVSTMNQVSPYAFVYTDYVSKINFSGYTSGQSVLSTENTKSLVESSSDSYGNGVFGYSNNKKGENGIAPRLLSIDPYMRREFAGGTIINKSSEEVSFISEDGAVNSIHGKMAKLSLAAGERVFFRLIGYKFSDVLNVGTPVSVGAWIYIASDAGYASFSTTVEGGGTYPKGDTTNVSVLNRWVFVQQTITDTNYDSLDTIDFIVKSNNADLTIYVDSIFHTVGAGNAEFVKNGIFADKSLFGELIEGKLKMNLLPTKIGSESGYIRGDLFPNDSILDGAMPYVTVEDGMSPVVVGNRIPTGIPDISSLPTENKGKGTMWLNNGVLTVGS